MKKAIFIYFVLGFSLFAQNPNWSLILQTNPYPTSFYSVWEKNPQTSTMTLAYTGLGGGSCKIRYILNNSSGKEILRFNSPLQTFSTAGTKIYTPAQFFLWDAKYDNQTFLKIIRTNRFPEGAFTIQVTVLDAAGNTTYANETSNFTIIYPSPATLIAPLNESTEGRLKPTFIWTPVNVPAEIRFKYQFKLVKVSNGQTVLSALNNNIPVYSDDNLSTNSFTYPETGLPLENGSVYAWRVRVTDDQGTPITSNDGSSEYWTFTYYAGSASAGSSNPFSVVELEKGVAWFSNFSQVQITSTGNNYILSGRTTLIVKLADGQQREFPATLQNLTFRKNQYNPFSFVGGSLIAPLSAGAIPANLTTKNFSATQIEFNPDARLFVRGNAEIPLKRRTLKIPGLIKIVNGRLTGVIEYNTKTANMLPDKGNERFPMPAGMYAGLNSSGMVTSRNYGSNSALSVNTIPQKVQPTDPIYKFGNSSVKIEITEFRLELPRTIAAFAGEIKIFNDIVIGQITNAQLDDDGFLTGTIISGQPKDINILPGEPGKYTLRIQGVDGFFKFDPENETSTIELNLRDPKLLMNVQDIFSQPLTCSAGFNAKLVHSSTEPTLNSFQVSSLSALSFIGAPISSNPIKFNPSTWMDVSELRLDSVVNNSRGLDFRIMIKGNYKFPVLNNLVSETVENIVFTKDGINLPAINNGQLKPGSYGNITVTPGATGMNTGNLFNNGINLDIAGITMPAFTLKSIQAGVPVIKLGFTLRPSFPSGTKGELANFSQVFSIAGGATGFTFSIAGRDLTTTELPLAVNALFAVKRFSGDITLASGANGLEINPQFKIKGQLKLSDGIPGCGPNQTIDFGATDLLMNGWGKISGPYNYVPQCSLKVGIRALKTRTAQLKFSSSEDAQSIILTGTAGLDISDLTGKASEVSVFFGFDVLKGTLGTIAGTLNADTLKLPKNNPAFNIAIKNLVVNKKGIVLNGRTEVRFVNGTKLGATFDSLKFSFDAENIAGGKIIFDKGLGLKVNLTAGNTNPVGDFIKKDSTFTPGNGLQIALPQTVTLSRDGISMNGTGTAKLKYNGFEFTLDAGFTDVKSNYSPFAITSSEINFSLDNRNYAWLKTTGFDIDISSIIAATLPERLPIKDSRIAYLNVRQGTNVSVDVNRLGGDTLQISTKPNQSVKAVFPGLALSSNVIPETDVTFSIKVNKNTYDLLSGSIDANIPVTHLSEFDLSAKDGSEAGHNNLPVKIKKLHYKPVNGTGKLTFEATLSAFNSDLGDETITLEVDDEGFLKGNLSGVALNKTYHPRSGEDSNCVVLSLYGVSGTFNTNLKNFTSPDYNLKFDARLKLGDTTNQYSIVFADIHLNKNGTSFSNQLFDANSKKMLNLGKIKFDLQWLTLDTLEYSHTNGWIFSMRMDAPPILKVGDAELRLRWIRDVVINNHGINFSRIVQNDFLTYGVGAATLNGTEIQALNLRMNEYVLSIISPSGIDYDSWGINMDLKASVPANVKDGGQSVSYAFGNSVKFSSEGLSGRLSYLPRGDARVETAGMDFYVNNFGGSIEGSEINYIVSGDLIIPNSLKRGRGYPAIKVDSLTLNSKGVLIGENEDIRQFYPSVKVLGQSATITHINLAFDTTETGGQKIDAEITANVAVRIPGGNVINTNGEYNVNMLTGEVDEESEIAINSAFELTLPDTSRPYLRVVVDSAVINSTGLVMNGPAQLSLKGSQRRLPVVFEDFAVSQNNLAFIEGSMTVMKPFAFSVKALPGKPLEFAAVDTNYKPTAANEIAMNIPEEFAVDSTYFMLEDEEDLKFRYMSKDFEDVSTAKYENPVIRFSDFKVTKGKISFMKDEERVGYIDANGFNVNIMALVPLPEEIMLGSRKTAYLAVREGEETFVRVEDAGDKLRLITETGKKVKLFVPGLAKDTNDVPFYNVTFSITVTKSNFEIVDGGITVAGTKAQPLFSLSKFGVPLSVVKLGYEKEKDGYQFTAEASIKLPAAIATDTLNVVLKIDREGNVQAKGAFGTVKSTYNSSAVYFKEFTVGSYAEFKFDGLLLELGKQQTVFKLSGDIYTKFFKDGNSATAKKVPLHFTATYANKEFKFGITPAGDLKIFKLVFAPLPGKQPAEMLTLTVPDDAEDFKLGFDGQIKADTSISKNLTFTVGGLKISKNNVELSSVTLPTNQEFNMFGAKLKLHSVGAQPAIALGYANEVFSITTSGTLNIMKKDIQFAGLKISSDGDISVNNITPNPALQIIPNAMWVSSLSVGRKPNTPPDAPIFLTVRGNVKLPKPAAQTPSNYEFRVGTDGTVEGSAKVVVFDYPWSAAAVQGRFEQSVWKGKFVVPYAAINVSFGENSSASIEAGLKLFVDEKNNKFVSLGDERQPNTPVPVSYKPGIKVATDGSIQFGPLSAGGLSEFEVGSLKFSNLTYRTESNSGIFGLVIGGSASLKLTSVSGGLNFRDLKLTTDPSFSFPKIDGGNLSVKNALNITVNKIDIQDDGEVEVDKVVITKDATGKTTRTQAKVKTRVTSYITFGGTVEVKNFGGGGMEKFLAYTTPEGGSYIYVKNAQLSIKKVVKITANISYEQDSRGFKLFVSGTGEIEAKPNKIGIAVVGKLAIDNNENVSAGVFVAATAGLNIRLGPIVVLTGLGGGFFYRPEQEDLAEVKKAAEIKSPGSVAKMDNAGTASNPTFAVLIYTRMSLGAAGLLDCKNLITITDEYINLSGDAVLLGRDNQIYGSYEITVKFNEVFIEGNLEVKVDIGSVITGGAKLQCWVYGSSNWGILGEVNYKLVPSGVSGSGSLYCGNKGFAVKFSMQAGFDFWIVSVKGGITVAAWYLPQENSWGAYFNVWIKAKVLLGLASFDGEMKGILIGAPEFMLAGTASGSACVNLIFYSNCWSGAVWAKFKKSGISGGLGRDSEIEGQLAYAENLANNIAAIARQAKADLKAAQFNKLFPNQEQIKAATQKLYEFSLKARVFPPSPNASDEINKAMFMVRDTLTEIMNSERIWAKYQASVDAWNKITNRVNGSDVVQFADDTKTNFNLMEQYSGEYKSTLEQIDNSFTTFEQNVAKKMEAVQTIAENPFQDPLSASFVAPVRKEVPGPGEGPQMSVNPQLALANTNEWDKRSAAIDAFQRTLDKNMATLVSIMDAFDNSFATGTGFYNLTAKYVQLRNQVDNAYSKLANYRVEDYKKTFDNYHFSHLIGLRGELDKWNITKTDAAAEIGMRKFSFVLWYLQQFLNGQQPTINQAVLNNTAWEKFYKEVWSSPGLKTEVGFKGVDPKAALLSEYIRSILYNMTLEVYPLLEAELAGRALPLYNERSQKIAAIDVFQTKFAGRMDNLFDNRKAMLETYLRVVNNYIYLKENNEGAANTSYSLQQLKQIKTDVISRSVPPTLNLLSMSWTNNYSNINIAFNWNASRNGAPVEIVDYQIKMGNQNAPWVSIGKTNSFTEKIPPYSAGISNVMWPYWLRARVKEGYQAEGNLTPSGTIGFSKQSLNLPATPQQINPASISAVERPQISGIPSFTGVTTLPDPAAFPDYMFFRGKLRNWFSSVFIQDDQDAMYKSTYYITKPSQFDITVTPVNPNAFKNVEYAIYKVKQDDQLLADLVNSFRPVDLGYSQRVLEACKTKGTLIKKDKLGQIFRYQILTSQLSSLTQKRASRWEYGTFFEYFDGYDYIYILAVTPYSLSDGAGTTVFRPFYYDNQQPVGPVWYEYKYNPFSNGYLQENGEGRNFNVKPDWRSSNYKDYQLKDMTQNEPGYGGPTSLMKGKYFKAPDKRGLYYAVIFEQPKASGTPLNKLELRVLDKDNNPVSISTKPNLWTSSPITIEINKLDRYHSSESYAYDPLEKFKYKYVVYFKVPMNYLPNKEGKPELQVEAAWISDANEKVSPVSKTSSIWLAVQPGSGSEVSAYSGPVTGYTGTNPYSDIYLVDGGSFRSWKFAPSAVVKEIQLLGLDLNTVVRTLPMPENGIIRMTAADFVNVIADYGNEYQFFYRVGFYGNKVSGNRGITIPKSR